MTENVVVLVAAVAAEKFPKLAFELFMLNVRVGSGLVCVPLSTVKLDDADEPMAMSPVEDSTLKLVDEPCIKPPVPTDDSSNR